MPDKVAKPDPSLRRKLLLSLVVLVIIFGLFEGLLALVGVRPVLEDRDPFVGFAANVPLFVPEVGPGGIQFMRTADNKHLFNRQSFPLHKAPGSVRVFCVGGSTTYGRPFDDTTSFAAWLRELLPEADRNVQWEIINAGGISYASYRVARLMQELAAYDPDLFVVYTGQNEFLEERTYRSLRRMPGPLRSVSAFLSRTRTWSAMQRAMRAAGMESGDAGADGDVDRLAGEADTLLEHFGPEVYERDDELREQILAHFRLSLERIARTADKARAKVVFVTPASNLKDCSPFKSEHTFPVDPDQVQRTTKALAAARKLLDENRPAEVLEQLEEALATDPRHAELHYRSARSLLRLDRSDEAAAEFTRALVEDVCPLRALPGMQRTVKEVARETGAGHVDYAAVVAADAMRTLGHPIVGEEHFLDHVHPTIDANGLLAAELVPRILAKLGRMEVRPDSASIALAGRRIVEKLDPDRRATALANLARVTAWSGKLEEAVRPARQALALNAGGPQTVAGAASILATWYATIGDQESELSYFRLALETDPANHDLHFRLALRELDRSSPQPELAAAHLTYAAVFWSGVRRDEPHRALAGILAQRGLTAAAMSHLLEARSIAPGNPQTLQLLDRVAQNLGPAATRVETPKFTVDRFPSGRVQRIVQVVLAPDGSAVADGVWTEWYENGQPARYAQYVGGQLTGAAAAWTEGGERLP